MQKTLFKSKEEIEFSLKSYKNIGIFSCGLCANLSYTGGTTGIETIKPYLEELGKTIIFSKVILAACPDEIMRKALAIHKEDLAKCDAVVILSCAAGIKSAHIAGIDLPVVMLLNPIGSSVVSQEDHFLTHSLCKSCGDCILSYTNGVCTLAHCTVRKKYEPCNRAPSEPGPCAVDPTRDCVFAELQNRNCDLQALKDVKDIHKAKDLHGIKMIKNDDGNKRGKGLFSYAAAKIEILENVIKLFR